MKKEKSVRKAEMKEAFVGWLKSMIAPVIITVIILVGILVIINFQNAAEPVEIVGLNGYDGTTDPIVMENQELKFTLDPVTTQFTLEVKGTGAVWYSNPPGAATDPMALQAEKGRLQSTLLMTYSTRAGLDTTYDNFNYGVDNGLYEIEEGEDYIRIDYSIGNVEREYVIPPVTTEVKFNEYLAQMSADDAAFIKRFYKKYDINSLGKGDDREELVANYPVLESEPIYVIRDSAQNAAIIRMEEIFEGIGYTYEEFTEDKELSALDRSNDRPVFNVSMIYRLDGGDLVVEVPFDSLENKDEYPIYTLTLLPYFGAGGTEDEGFLMVPEGGGALINFNNGKLSQSAYYANLYGWDMALSREAVVHDTRAYFNAFGIANNGNSFVCILEEGAPYASIRADISGRIHSYNYVNAVYSVQVREMYDVGSIATSNIYQYLEILPDETLTQRYRFVDTDNYVDMAKAYQDYLKDNYEGYFVKNDDTSAPVAIEIVGAVDKVKQILGIPVSRPLKLTTYSEAEEMIKELKSDGMENMSVKLTGWCNGGVSQKILKNARTISALGSKKDLQSLSDTAKELGVALYLDGVTHYEYDSNIFNGFFSFTDAARFITKERAELFIYSHVTYAAREGADSYYLLHGDLIDEMTDNLAAAADKYGTGVSFRDTGMDLSSDYYKKNPTSRQEALYEQVENLKEIVDSGKNVMINMGNDYALPYSDMITNMDLTGSGYTILDKEIPFYQLAIHGYVNYTGMPLNICGDEAEELLESVEYGAGIYFTLMRETAFALQKTLYTEYYASDYAAWHDRMMDIYNRYNAELGHTFNQEMTDHVRFNAELSCTTYEDGTKVYVNYSFADVVTPDGVEVPARDYKVVR